MACSVIVNGQKSHDFGTCVKGPVDVIITAKNDILNSAQNTYTI